MTTNNAERNNGENTLPGLKEENRLRENIPLSQESKKPDYLSGWIYRVAVWDDQKDRRYSVLYFFTFGFAGFEELSKLVRQQTGKIFVCVLSQCPAYQCPATTYEKLPDYMQIWVDRSKAEKCLEVCTAHGIAVRLESQEKEERKARLIQEAEEYQERKKQQCLDTLETQSLGDYIDKLLETP